MGKLEWQEPELIDLSIVKTEAAACSGESRDGFWDGNEYPHPHYS